jgi:LacI family transcriptional regulator
MAIGAVRGACELGLSVPADLSIAGFDDIQLASYITPSLTTVVQPKTEMARTAVRLLLERMAERSLPARRQVLLPTLVVRESSRACQLKGGVAGT